MRNSDFRIVNVLIKMLEQVGTCYIHSKRKGFIEKNGAFLRAQILSIKN